MLVENTLPVNNPQTKIELEANRMAGLESNRYVSAEMTYEYTDPPAGVKRLLESLQELRDLADRIYRKDSPSE